MLESMGSSNFVEAIMLVAGDVICEPLERLNLERLIRSLPQGAKVK